MINFSNQCYFVYQFVKLEFFEVWFGDFQWLFVVYFREKVNVKVGKLRCFDRGVDILRSLYMFLKFLFEDKNIFGLFRYIYRRKVIVF